MKAGEFFINLGIKGSDKTVGALTGVQKGMGELRSMSLETKAALVGVFYGLEKLMAHSASLGTSLTQSSALLGINAKTLQQWQYAGVQAGDTAEGVVSSIKGIQSAMAELYVGGGPAQYLGLVGERLLGKGGFDVQRAMKEPLYVLERLQELSKDQNIPTGVLTKIYQSFGVGEGTNVALRKGAFNSGNFAKAPTLSDETVSRLQKVEAMWANLERHIGIIFDKFTAAHGGQLVVELTQVADALGTLASGLERLAQYLHLFEGIAWLFKMAGTGAEVIGNGTVAKDLKESGIGKWLSGLASDFNKGSQVYGPSQPYGPPAPSAQTVSIQQNITHYGDAKDTKAVGDTHKQAIKNAAKQSFGLTQDN